jgi:hypothetical protein
MYKLLYNHKFVLALVTPVTSLLSKEKETAVNTVSFLEYNL